jgi:hypothetical protein
MEQADDLTLGIKRRNFFFERTDQPHTPQKLA